MEDNIIQPLVKTAEHGTSALDKFMGILKNRSDLKYNRELKEIEKTNLQETINIIENANIPIIYNKDGLGIINPQMQNLLERTGNRLKAQEILKQVNIESVLEKTQTVLEENKEKGDDNASSEPVNNDFLTQFINGAGEISDQEMQLMWAKLLAGEIKQPRSFSLRTLSKLKTLTTNEARLFEKIAPYIICNDCVVSNEKILNEYEIKFESLIILNDCGIINLLSGMSKIISGNASVQYNDLICIINQKTNVNNMENTNIHINGYILTNFGKELLKIMQVHYNNSFFIRFAKDLKEKNKENFFISCYEAKGIEHDNVVCKFDKDLLI